MSIEPHGFHIRRGTLDDVEAVVALDRATPLLPRWTKNEYAATVESTANDMAPGGVRRSLFVAESAGALAGFAVVKVARIAEDVVAELESVAVAVSSQRRGVGKALCVAAIEWCRRRGARSMELEVRSRNEAAIALYVSLGFVVQGTRPRYYRDPPDNALLMRLGLV